MWCVVLLTGCSWFGSEEPDKELVQLRQEVAQMRMELARMRDEDDVAFDVLEQQVKDTPEPTEAVRRSDLSALKEEIAAVEGAAVGALDEELSVVEAELDAMRQTLGKLQQEIDVLDGTLNNHADVIDLLVSDIDALETETAPLVQLGTVLRLQNGQVVLDGVDLVYQPGKAADGGVRKTGPVFPDRTF